MGFRQPKNRILTQTEIDSIEKEAESIEIDTSVLRFNEGNRTGYYEYKGVINIRGDVLPDVSSTISRDRMSSRAVLAHEYYGHYMRSPSKFDIGDWRDEFSASYFAAVETPNLTSTERADLMLDAYSRAEEAGVIIAKNAVYRRLVYGY